MGDCLFYLGTHRPNWLALVDVPLFISRRQLAPYRTLPRARGPWALDSGGFTEIATYGRWETSARDYAAEVRRIADGVGWLSWAAPQDWMCEPAMLAKTGLDVDEHQDRSVQSYLDLKSIAPDLPFIPVLQGWERDDYARCWAKFEAAGVDLAAQPIVGVGTVCRRQHTADALAIFRSLRGLRLHGFGVKSMGLKQAGHLLASADSMAWSLQARKYGRPTCGSTTHKNCANCLSYALAWRERVVAGVQDGDGRASLFGRLR